MYSIFPPLNKVERHYDIPCIITFSHPSSLPLFLFSEISLLFLIEIPWIFSFSSMHTMYLQSYQFSYIIKPIPGKHGITPKSTNDQFQSYGLRPSG